MKKKPSEEKSPVAFWEEFLKVMNQNSDLFKDVSPRNVGIFIVTLFQELSGAKQLVNRL